MITLACTVSRAEFRRLIEQHARLLHGVALAYCRNPSDRDDVLQEIAIQLWRARERYDGRTKVTTWMYRIAINAAISCYRRERRHAAEPLAEDPAPPHTSPSSPPSRRASQRVAPALPARTRDRYNRAMKSSLTTGLSSTKQLMIDEGRCIGFMGKEGMVYATPRMVLDVEFTCRELLLAHLDEGEDSVGAHVSIDHLAATPLGLEVTIDVKIVDIEKRRVTFEFSVRDSIEDCGRGKHVRFVADKAKSFERIKAKRAKAGL